MSSGKRILIVDDDDMLAEMLADQINRLAGIEAVIALTAADGLARATGEYFDLVLLDVSLPDGDGRDVCRAMRKAGLHLPIVMLTAADTDADTIEGLESGATDYVTKPFKLGVLLARIRAHIRQFEQSDEATLAIGPFAFRPGAKQLQANGTTIRLTDKEAQILKYLYLHGGDVVSREELLGEVWGYNAAVATHTLETHVYRLRQKIETDPSNAELLLTETGGYRLAI